MIEEINRIFYEKFQTKGLNYFAPGRVNLIGEHTDYNLGFVLPGAIDKRIYLEILPNNSDDFNVYAGDLNEFVSFKADGKKSEKPWANYIIGVVMEFKALGYAVKGFNAVFKGDIPLGAGLSSSAALESVFAYAINDIQNFNLASLELAKIGQRAEHNYAGVKCGIMDQFASIHGKENKLIRLDCRSLEYKLIDFDIAGYKILLVDTNVKHELANSEYNKRRQECEQGVEIIRGKYKFVESLRDVDLDILADMKSAIPELIFRRCKYVVEENLRLMRACEALEKGDLQAFGQEMYGSHEGLKTEYEVSCERLDFLVDLAKTKSYILGSRMMGGGFGGCTINLIESTQIENFITEVKTKFQTQFHSLPKFYEANISGGAGRC